VRASLTSWLRVLDGTGRFVAERTIEVTLNDGGTRNVRGDKVFLDLGAFSNLPALPGLAEVAPLTHVELLDLDVVPQHLLILGGGYIALELAQAMRRLGSRVTVCEGNERILGGEDPDIAEAILKLLQDEGIEFITSAHVDRVSGRSGAIVTLHAMIDETEKTIEGSHLLVAVGEAPNTNDIGLERAGIELTPLPGYVRVNDKLETTAPAVWAMGDCAGSQRWPKPCPSGTRRPWRPLQPRSAISRQAPSAPPFAERSGAHPVTSLATQLADRQPAVVGTETGGKLRQHGPNYDQNALITSRR
jgi:pyruvate/2-oxoglutarate dehydrogenase complex dihydrolipoamide dehydrogenase (E3) component